MTKKRVWCLYRVSSKIQVSADDDIPIQRKACLDFVATKPDWEITNELYEKGVSGWKKKAADRDEMNIVKAGAIKKEFDVLLVFMYDRLGRREDETPFVVQFLIEQGVEVWSVQEGQTKINQHVDKLLNFIRFWQSSGESDKTSIRVTEAKKQLGERGLFIGGPVPYGYDLVETEQAHWKSKDKMTKEFVINEEEAEVIRLIFSLYVEKHMGFRKITDYLNSSGYRNRKGKLFGVSAAKRILTNPVYIGRRRFTGRDNNEESTQEYKENLRIIPDSLFNMAEKILTLRQKKSSEDANTAEEKASIPLAGKLMFSGLTYCMACGRKLGSSYFYQKNYGNPENGKRAIYRYRCFMHDGKLTEIHRNSQTLWAAKKYDKLLINEIKQMFSQLDVESYVKAAVKQKKYNISQKEKNVKNLEKEIEQYKKQMATLNGEISKSLLGESNFTPEQLSTAIKTLENQLKQANEKCHELLEEINNKKEDFSEIDYIANELKDWENKFDNADNDLKKAMLSRIVNKVYLGKNVVKVEYNLSLEECLKQAKEKTNK